MGLRRKTLRRHKRKTKRKQRGGDSEEDDFIRKWAPAFIKKQMDKGMDNKEIREILYKKYQQRMVNKRMNPRKHSKTLKKILYEAFKDEKILDKDYISYPETTEGDFQAIIANKREFYENRNHSVINRCGDSKFQLTPHQQLLGNFMTPGSIYKSILLFHGTGTGKTCTAITIAENFRKQVKKNGKIMVICGKSVKNNFYGNIFDRNKLSEDNLEYLDYQCTGRTYYDMIDSTKKKTPTQQYKAIKKKIKDFYDIKTYYTFAMELDKVKSKDKTDNKSDYIKYIHKNYSNRLIIVDEVQALRDSTEGKSYDYKKKIPEILYDIARYSNNTRFVLLSATPMFNESEEIIWLINLMRINDNKVPLKLEDVFEDGELINVDIFKEYSKGYISYLRGEDPINFPLRLYPHNEDGGPNDNVMQAHTIPTKDFFGRENPINHFEELQLFCCEAKGYQYEVLLEEQNKFKGLKKKLELSEIGRLKQMSLLVCPDNKCYGKKKGITGIMRKITKERIEFGGTKRKTKITQYKYRDAGDKQFLKWDPVGEKPLENYSIKFAKTIESIHNFIKSGNKGIIFVYCSQIEFGIIPFCLALEQYGLQNYSGDALLDPEGLNIKPISYNGAQYVPGQSFYPAQYIMVTGKTPINTRDDMIHDSKQPQNIDGSNIRVIVGSDVMSEGIDLKWVREVHVLDPWYHMNKIEQIIGRGIRFCSHAHPNFPEEERNVTVFLYCIKSFDDCDTSDMYLYREAWRKALQMGKVEKALKESAIDCSIHKEVNVFEQSESRMIKTPYSKAKSIQVEIKDKEYSKICSYGPECNFTCMNDTDSSDVSSSTKRKTLDKDTYNIKHNKHRIKQIITIIRDYFKNNVVINYDILSKLSSRHLNIPEVEIKEIVIHSLNKVVESKINIKHGNKGGKIVQKGIWYLFEVTNRSDMPLYFRQHQTKKKKSRRLIKQYKPDSQEDIDQLVSHILYKEYDIINEDIRALYDILDIENKDLLLQLYLIDRLKYSNMVKYYAFVYLNRTKHTEVTIDGKPNLSNTPHQYEYIEDSFIEEQEHNSTIFLVFEQVWEGTQRYPNIIPRFYSINLKNEKISKIEKGQTKYTKYLKLFLTKLRIPDPNDLICWKHVTEYNERQFRYTRADMRQLGKQEGKIGALITAKHGIPSDAMPDIFEYTTLDKDSINKNKKKLAFFSEMMVRKLSTEDNKIWYNNLEYGMWKYRN